MSGYILHSGGAAGSEAYFGQCAENHGLEEVNYTFEDHKIQRDRGLRVLNEDELLQGDVSLDYVSKLMNRDFPNTKLFRRILQTIWYQINDAQEIYVVGKILEDKTVKGGTGWGAEYAKICNKPLFVFDQEANTWNKWNGTDWDKLDAIPKITHTHFAGTGTRILNDSGRAAIEDLFKNSFA